MRNWEKGTVPLYIVFDREAVASHDKPKDCWGGIHLTEESAREEMAKYPTWAYEMIDTYAYGELATILTEYPGRDLEVK